MNRSILIITPFFAPQSHAAVFRAYKLAKYLPQYGWKPYIITTDTNYLYNEDMSLLENLPPEVEIYRTRHIEPSIRGLRMALGGRDRTFKAIKEATTGHSATATTNKQLNQARPSLARKIYNYLLQSWLNSPDGYWLWEKGAVNKASELIRNYKIPLIFTSANPRTSHRIGYQLQKKTGVRWVADFRDPGVHSHKMISEYDRVFMKQRRIEKLTVQNADAITVLAESYALIFKEMYGLKDDNRLHFITTGLDEALLDNAEHSYDLPTHSFFLFVGEFVRYYDDHFFRLFSEAVKNERVTDQKIKLVFIGRSDINIPALNPIIKRYGLEKYIEILDHMPQEKLYRYITEAKATLLTPGRRSLWWNLYAKLVDYIALRKPVIAIVPNPSEARMHLQRSGLGIFLDGDEEKNVKRLTELILAENVDLDVDQDYCDQFLAQSQVKRFVEIFEQLASEPQ